LVPWVLHGKTNVFPLFIIFYFRRFFGRLGRNPSYRSNSWFWGPGYYSTQWNGRNQQGQTVGAGVYFYQIQSNGFIQTRKMLLLK